MAGASNGSLTTAPVASYKSHRFPAEIMAHTVWLYFRCSLSYRDVEDLLAARGLRVTDATVRQWCLKFGQVYANQLRRRRPQPGDKWPLAEVFLQINGPTPSLGRAVDPHGHVWDILVTAKRHKHAAKRFFRKRLGGGPYGPRVIAQRCVAHQQRPVA